MADVTLTKYMRIEAACEWLGCSRKKVRQMAVDAGALYKVDKVLLIEIEKLDEYVQKFFKVSEE